MCEVHIQKTWLRLTVFTGRSRHNINKTTKLMQFGMSFRCKILKLVVARQSHYIHAKLYSNLTNQTPGIVYVSTSTDVFTNLAWEQWWYENGNFTSHRALLIYCNDPCVVVGRHQNPWVECDVKEAAVSSLPLSRRQSGGGTVYHDLGNINCSFMTSRKHYNRRENLDFLADLISTRWDLDVSVNIRDDLILDNFYKVSGSAAKLGKDTAYHHCTLLVNSGLTALHSILRPDRLGWSSNATASVPSPVATLASAAVDINTESVIEAIAEAYLSAYENSVTLVTPSDSVCPGWKSSFIMLLPSSYMGSKIDEYMEDASMFLTTYKWICDFQLTKFFTEQVWERIPTEVDWLQKTDLGTEEKRGMTPKKVHEVEWMSSLVADVCLKTQCDVVVDIGAGLGYLSRVLSSIHGLRVICIESDGSRTLGAERRANRHSPTSKPQCITQQLTSDDIGGTVKRLRTVLQGALGCDRYSRNDARPSGDGHSGAVCMIGLHCCGDLTPTMLKVYAEMPEIRALVCVSCCYHKMVDGTVISRMNFPMSTAAKRFLRQNQGEERNVDLPPCLCDSNADYQCSQDRYHTERSIDNVEGKQQSYVRGTMKCQVLCSPSSSKCEQKFVNDNAQLGNNSESSDSASDVFPIVNSFALRLAAQETRVRWRAQTADDHELHTRTVAYRAILEHLANSEDGGFRKFHRKVTSKSSFESFESYLDAAILRTTLDACGESDQSVKGRLRELYTRFQPLFPSIEIITALQVCMQSVLESVLTIDRCCFLQERHLVAEIAPIFLENISPRNLAIISRRN
ncbi:PREDICTED: uncharacterized protein LOC106809081 isoform X2 [Priapulus caudatus]|uniref:Uncharacterized protein LOC106809081 isoform X2 n=1 Tax=Priapulus caudatus TaxID=37621 RepID=A0ABM1E5P8_PRICU|nr:PREDICTED: uncharacterized protein LOC106809081 isoform X2 [Priapulus caudatus]